RSGDVRRPRLAGGGAAGGDGDGEHDEDDPMSSARHDATARTVAANLKAERVAAGLTQSDLAAGMGLTFQQVQKYERCTNRISIDALKLAADALRVPLGRLLAGVEDGDVPRERERP